MPPPSPLVRFRTKPLSYLLLRYPSPFRRPLSTKPPSPTRSRTRLHRLLEHTPRFLRPYLAPVTTAPLSHVTSFLLLHEISAVVPLLGLAAFFHYTDWLPAYFAEGKWVSEGIRKFDAWFRRRGWITEEEGKEVHGRGEDDGKPGRWWDAGEGGVRVMVEFATAYAVTKALLPLRLILSVWATPWFARVVIMQPTSWFTRVFRKDKAVSTAVPSAVLGARILPKGSVNTVPPRTKQ